MKSWIPILLAVGLLWESGCAGHRHTQNVKPPPARAPVVSAHTVDDDTLYASRTPATWDGKIGERCREMQPLMEEAASRHTTDVGLIAGIVRVESAFRPEAVSSAGAKGLMQVMPLNGKNLKCGDLSDPVANLDCGIRVLKGFLKYYDDQLIYALSGYNAGFRRPNSARKISNLPTNHWYVERVFSARSSYLRDGCGN